MGEILKKEGVSNVLFVDNDMEIQSSIEMMKHEKKNANLNFIVAKNAKEGLEKLASEQIDLVILEIVLPMISGYFLINEIKKKYANLPIIIYTRLKKSQDLAKMAASGALNIYLKELIEIEQLIEKIKNEGVAESIDKTVIKLNEQIKALVDAESSHIEKMTQCSKCSLMIPPDSHFCNNCGQRVQKKAEKKLIQKTSNEDAEISNKTPNEVNEDK